MRLMFYAGLTALLLCLTSAFGSDGWCFQIADRAGDKILSEFEFSLPTESSDIYVSYKVSKFEQIYVEIEDKDSGLLLNTQTLSCRCHNSIIYASANPFRAGRTLRFRVGVEPCFESETEVSGEVTVNFFTPSENVCGFKCGEEN